jgi:hypothetical protein
VLVQPLILETSWARYIGHHESDASRKFLAIEDPVKWRFAAADNQAIQDGFELRNLGVFRSERSANLLIFAVSWMLVVAYFVVLRALL